MKVKDKSAKLKEGILIYDLVSAEVVQAAEVPLVPIICEPDTIGLDAMLGRVQTQGGISPATSKMVAGVVEQLQCECEG